MSRLVLFRALGSPPARSVMMLGDILGLDMEYYDVKLLRNEHKSDEFRKINPMGTVPVLQDGDFIVSESHAILKYLVSSYGGSQQERLHPSDVRARAVLDQCLFFNSGYLFPRMAAIMLPALFRGVTTPPPQQLAAVDEAYAAIEAYLQKHRFLVADHFTLADLSVGATATATLLLRDLDKDKYPRFANWIQELEQMPFFKNINAEGIAYLRKFMQKAREVHSAKVQSKN